MDISTDDVSRVVGVGFATQVQLASFVYAGASALLTFSFDFNPGSEVVRQRCADYTGICRWTIL